MLDDAGRGLPREPAAGARHRLLQPHRVRVGHGPASAPSRPSPAAAATTALRDAGRQAHARLRLRPGHGAHRSSRCRPSARSAAQEPDAFVVHAGEAASREAWRLGERLRDAGLVVRAGRGRQLQVADEEGRRERRALRYDPRRRRDRAPARSTLKPLARRGRAEPRHPRRGALAPSRRLLNTSERIPERDPWLDRTISKSRNASPPPGTGGRTTLVRAARPSPRSCSRCAG